MINKQKTIGVFGAKGFVGSEISKYLKYLRYDVIDITRETFENDMFKEYDYVINAACSSERWKAKSAPYYDFEESVEKTAQIFYEAKYKKFIQISSLSARCQTNTIYGRNRLAAESIVNDGNSLIVRLGSMYGPTLMKGPLIDMINKSTVYASSESKYSFSPLSFNADWIARNLDRTGIYEVGSKNSIKLGDLARKLNLNINFIGSIDNQEVMTNEKDYPDVNLVIGFMKEKIRNKN